MLYHFVCFFFFKQKTAYEMRISDWSSDVCSSDLLASTGNTGHLLHRLRPQFEPAFEEWRPTLHHPFDIARRQAVANQRLHPIDVDLMDGVKVWKAKKGAGLLRRAFDIEMDFNGEDRKSKRLKSSK